MRIFVSLLVISAMTFGLVLLPPSSNAQEADSATEAAARLQAIVDAIWDLTAEARAHTESTWNVSITKEHGMRTMQEIYPRAMKTTLERAQRRWGIEIIELDGGYVKIITSRPLVKAGGLQKDGGITWAGFVSAVGFVWLCLNLYQLGDDYIEDELVQDCMASEHFSEGVCEEIANQLTDKLRYLAYPVPPCGSSGKFCIPRMLNDMERVREHRPPRPEPLHPPGQARTPPPAGMTPQEMGSALPSCAGGGIHNSDSIALPPAPEGTSGTIIDSITVTGRDPCR